MNATIYIMKVKSEKYQYFLAEKSTLTKSSTKGIIVVFVVLSFFKKTKKMLLYFSFYSMKTNVVGVRKDCFNEDILMSTQNVHFMNKSKKKKKKKKKKKNLHISLSLGNLHRNLGQASTVLLTRIRSSINDLSCAYLWNTQTTACINQEP